MGTGRLRGGEVMAMQKVMRRRRRSAAVWREVLKDGFLFDNVDEEGISVRSSDRRFCG